MPEISVRLSRKAGGGKDDAAKTLTATKPDLDRVSGQRAYVGVVCWYCFALNEIAEPAPGETFTYTCWNCGNSGVV